LMRLLGDACIVYTSLLNAEGDKTYDNPKICTKEVILRFTKSSPAVVDKCSRRLT
jgi:hypothetical protein